MSKDISVKDRYKDLFNEIQPDEDFKIKIKTRSFKKNKRILSGWVAGLIIIVLLGSVTSVVAMVKHFSFLKLFSSEKESFYAIQVEINKVNHNDFRGEITEIHDLILQRQKNYKPYMNQDPLVFTKYFDSIGDCMNYIGISTTYFTIIDDVPVTLEVSCNESGEINQILIMSDYKIDGNNIQMWYYIFSDLAENSYQEIVDGIGNRELIEEGRITSSIDQDSIIFETTASENLDYQIDTQTLKNGQQVPIILSGKNDNNIETAESYFSKEEIVYSIHVSSESGNEKSAREVIEEILQLFY